MKQDCYTQRSSANREFCQQETCNGGFKQFFSNSTAVLAPEAVEGFAAIGQVRVASTLGQALILLGSVNIRQRKDRQAALALLPRNCFEDLEERFFALIGSENSGF